jgi:hypothetical protein
MHYVDVCELVMPEYAELAELVAQLILGLHACGPACFCRKLREIPAIKEAVRRVECLQAPLSQ